MVWPSPGVSDAPSFAGLDIPPPRDPIPAQGGQSLLHRSGERLVAPRAAAIIDPDRFVGTAAALVRLGWVRAISRKGTRIFGCCLPGTKTFLELGSASLL